MLWFPEVVVIVSLARVWSMNGEEVAGAVSPPTLFILARFELP